MKYLVIIQARMGSTRLPGKVLVEVDGVPLLERMLSRVKKSKLVDNIIIATTTNKEDDEIVNLAQNNGVIFFRGSENDVLGRVACAAKEMICLFDAPDRAVIQNKIPLLPSFFNFFIPIYSCI